MNILESENLSKILSNELVGDEILDTKMDTRNLLVGDEILDAKMDTRNLVDEYKGLSNEEVKERLAEKRNSLEIAIENVDHDFNAGTIVRSANNFNVSKVHIVGRRKYNRRGAMCTDKYLEIVYWPSMEDFMADQRARKREVVAIAKPLGLKRFESHSTLVFGSEGNGISLELVNAADDVRYIESFGSTRSVNVGVAAGIAMYEWVRQNVINA